MKLYFVRHGESEANILNVISNRGYRHGLTETGRQQTQALAGQLSAASISRIYTSPLLRAVQTAEILSQALRALIKIAIALREYDCGVLEGKSDEESWALHRQVREDWMMRGLWEKRIEGGESFCEMRDRFVPFVRRVIAENPDNASNLILVGHGGLFICLLPLVLENVSFEFAWRRGFPPASFVLAESCAGRLVCLEWCGHSV